MNDSYGDTTVYGDIVKIYFKTFTFTFIIYLSIISYT